MTQLFMTVPPPDRWQDFERLTLALCARVWDDPDAESVGRPGQPQGGVDIVGWDRQRPDYWRVGVQCKRRDGRQADGSTKAGGLLTLKDIKREIAKTRNVTPGLNQFIIATTAAQDVVLQEQVSTYSVRREKNGRSTVRIYFWEWFVEHLNRHVDLLYLYHGAWMRAAGEYNPHLHSVGLLRTAFDRPFLRTPFISENSSTGVGEAIVSLQQVVSTGLLKDADGATIASAPPPRQFPSGTDRDSVSALEIALQEMREDFTQAVRAGSIVQHPFTLELRDYVVAGTMDAHRQRLLAILNPLFLRNGMAPIASPFAS